MASVDRCPECGGSTVKVSWSSLKTFEACQQKSHLMRTGRKPAMKDIRNFFPGRVTDRVVRYWLQEDPKANKGRMPSMVHAIIEAELGEASEGGERVDWKHRTDRDEVEAACIKAVTDIEPALERYVLPYTWQVDFGFRTPVMMAAPWGMERVVLNGYMDILVYDPDTDSWRVYDVKHTANKDYWKGSFGQLVFYSLENQIRTGKLPVEVGFFQPLVAESVKRFEVTEQHTNYLASRIQAMVGEIWAGEAPPNGSPSECMFCEVKHACVKYQPVRDGRRAQVPLL